MQLKSHLCLKSFRSHTSSLSINAQLFLKISSLRKHQQQFVVQCHYYPSSYTFPRKNLYYNCASICFLKHFNYFTSCKNFHYKITSYNFLITTTSFTFSYKTFTNFLTKLAPTKLPPTSFISKQHKCM